MSITRNDILHLAELARIHLTESEIERFEKELPSILEFVGTLEAVPTDDVLQLAGGTATANVFRSDGEGVPPLSDPLELRIPFLKVNHRGDLVTPPIFDRKENKENPPA